MNPAIIAALIPALTELGKMGYDAFKSKPESPTNAAQPWLEKAQGLYEPYQKQGQDAYGGLNQKYSQMMNDPGGYLDQLSKGYTQSDAFKRSRDAALTGASNSAAAGGMAGSLQDITNESQLSSALSGADFQQWLKNAMGIQNTGLAGEQGFYNAGLGATGDMANLYGTRGNLDVLGEMFKNQQSEGGMNDFFKSLSGLGGTLGKIDWGELFKKKDPFTSGQGYSGGGHSLGIDTSMPNSSFSPSPWGR